MYSKREVINANIFSQVDFQLEIIDDIGSIASKTGSDKLGKLASDAVFVWLIAEENFKVQIPLVTEQHIKANILRILQYFKLRAIYLNTVFYVNLGREHYDLKKQYKSNELGGFDTIIEAKKKFGRVPKSNLPFSMLQELNVMFTKHWRKEQKLMKKNKAKLNGKKI